MSRAGASPPPRRRCASRAGAARARRRTAAAGSRPRTAWRRRRGTRARRSPRPRRAPGPTCSRRGARGSGSGAPRRRPPPRRGKSRTRSRPGRSRPPPAGSACGSTVARARRQREWRAEVRRSAPNCAELRGAPDAVLEDGDPRAREAEKVLRRRRDVARRRAAAAAAVARSAFVRVVLVSRRLLLRPRGATPVALRRVAVAVARRLLAALPGEPRAEHVARELLLRVRLRRAERPQLAAALGAGGVVLEVLLLLGDLGREGGGGGRVEEVGGWRRWEGGGGVGACGACGACGVPGSVRPGALAHMRAHLAHRELAVIVELARPSRRIALSGAEPRAVEPAPLAALLALDPARNTAKRRRRRRRRRAAVAVARAARAVVDVGGGGRRRRRRGRAADSRKLFRVDVRGLLRRREAAEEAALAVVRDDRLPVPRPRRLVDALEGREWHTASE